MTRIPPHELNPWPSSYAYCLAHRCPTCGAPVGVDCTAPLKAAAATPAHRQHVTRQDLGGRHHTRDLAATPYEHRVLGHRHDTLGDQADPCNRAHWETPATLECAEAA